jgi:hypothetical protein
VFHDLSGCLEALAKRPWLAAICQQSSSGCEL